MHETPEHARYGDGIRTLILFNNRLNELKDIKNDDMEAEDNDQYESIRMEMEKLTGAVGLVRSNTSEKEDDRSYKTKTKYLFNILILAVFVLVLTFVILAIVDYQGKVGTADNIFRLYDFVDYSHRRTSEIQNILSNIREIYLTNLGLFGATGTDNYRQRINNSISRISASLITIKQVQNTLVSKDIFQLVPDNQILNTQDITTIYYQDNTSIKSDLDKGVQQFYSVTFDLINNDLNLITMDYFKVYFLEFNMFNDFWSVLMRSSDNIVIQIRSLSDYSSSLLKFQIIFICLFIVLYAFYSSFFYFMLLMIKRPKHELLNNFLRIQDYVVTFYQNRCEMFLLYLAAEDSTDELNNSMDDDDENMALVTTNILMQDTHKRLKGESEDDGMISKKKIKKAKYQKNNFTLFIILFVFIGVIFAYFFLVMNIYSSLMQKLNVNLDEYNVTSLTETYFYFTDNAQRFNLALFFVHIHLHF